MQRVLFTGSYPILNLELLRRNQRRMSRSEIVNSAVPGSPQLSGSALLCSCQETGSPRERQQKRTRIVSSYVPGERGFDPQ